MAEGGRHANPLYGLYTRLPALIRRGIAAAVPEGRRARVRYWARGEASIIDAELARLDGHEWRGFRPGLSTAGTTERVVEIPWTLSRYAGERRVLDIGTAYAIPAYVRGLRRLGVPELYGVDLLQAAVPGVAMRQADVRQMPFEDGFFDLVFCVSTLEHIGLDNRAWGIRESEDMQGDLNALREIRRVMRDGGRLLVTVPFGKARRYQWFKQYDLSQWQSLIAEAGLKPGELAFFGYGQAGWTAVDDGRALESADYRALGAQGATAILCAELRR